VATQTEDASYIDPIHISRPRRDAVEPQAGDTYPREIEQAEMRYIRALRARRGCPGSKGRPENLSGLALSGGGIRSATFSLGIMQALARRGVLQRIDFLSTVSGGGYIGSAVSWLISEQARQPIKGCGASDVETQQPNTRLGMDAEGFPFGTDDPAPDAEIQDNPTQRGLLGYLRHHGYYLAPGNGITILSLLAVVLRGTLLNLLVWVPAVVLFFLIGLWGSGEIANRFLPDWQAGAVSLEEGTTPSWMILPRLLSAVQPRADCAEFAAGAQAAEAAVGDCSSAESVEAFDAVRKRLPHLLGFELFLDLTALIILALVGGMLAYSLFTWYRRAYGSRGHCFWYRSRRGVEQLVTVLIRIGVTTLVVGTLPVVSVYLHGWMMGMGPLAAVSGLSMTMYQFFANGLGGQGKLSPVLVSLGAGLLLYGLSLVTYELAFLGSAPAALPGWHWVALLVWVAVFGWFVNLNYISVHRFYRDRLMETFMPDISSALRNRTGKAVGADSATLQQVADPDDPRGPFPIVNTNVILVDSKEPVYSQRGGDNFILTPLYCGSNATGWRRTPEYMDGQMTLATAVAISGAALNPNSGVGGEGLTRNRVLSLVMYLLNLRLGYWACHPHPRLHPWHGPNHFHPGLYAVGNALKMPGIGFTERHHFLQLSDGGQFENMAVYELVRRRLGLIIVCDGGEDADFTFSDFQTTVRRIDSDFGAKVSVHPSASPDQMIPGAAEEAKYPMGADFSKRGYMICTIHYRGGGTGILLYLKSTLIDNVSFRVKGYKAQYKEFPDQSTVDQFFDEVQFESYRELGYRLACQMLDDELPAGIGPATLPEKNRIRDFIEDYCPA